MRLTSKNVAYTYILIVLCRYPPFYGEHPFETYEKICEGNYKFPAHFDEDAKDLVSKLLVPTKSRRLGNLHGGAQDVKNHPFFKAINWQLLLDKKIAPPIAPEVFQKTRNYAPESQEDDPEYDLETADGQGRDDPYETIFREFE